jgi:hypothetical protein
MSAICWIATAGRAEAQLGALVSPGPLAKAHASVEGANNCQQCHERGRKVTAEKCLTCHAPIARRMQEKRGVHKDVTDCVKCHVDHAGVKGDLRPFDTVMFNHAAVTGFALDGKHAPLRAKCESCHTTRSFLEARPACATCHADPHKNTLGSDCTSCHSTAVLFKAARTDFDHTRARFALTGAHRTVTCEKCHAAGRFRGVRFATCTACHQEPHQGRFGPACTTCHVTDQWATKTVEHEKTRFPLAGAHAQVACAKCHQAGVTKPIKSDTCSSCHVNVHRDSVKDDCRACHTETSFANASFDHAARTGFPLADKHAGLECRKCHTTIATADIPLARKVIDFAGVSGRCVSCHPDRHKGEYGLACDACHRPTGFSVAGFTHLREPEFYTGQHRGVECVRCHVPDARAQLARTGPPATVPPLKPSMACASCHADPHLGQVGATCERCHAVDGAKFTAVRFSHDTAAFPLTGKHESIECTKCHRTVARAYPSGTGSAVQFQSMPKDCRGCHDDEHLGQFDTQCETCHSTSAFRIPTYKHPRFEQFFAGNHGRLACAACHKKETGQFPAGSGTAVRFKVGTTCAACHKRF